MQAVQQIKETGQKLEVIEGDIFDTPEIAFEAEVKKLEGDGYTVDYRPLQQDTDGSWYSRANECLSVAGTELSSIIRVHKEGSIWKAELDIGRYGKF